MFLISNGTEQACVESLEGYDGWAVVAEVAAPPEDDMVFSGKGWEYSPDILKAQTLIKGKQSMGHIRGIGLSTIWGVFDSDEKSQHNLFGCLAVAQGQEDFTVDWTLQNNSVASLDYTKLKSVCIQLQAFETSLHARMQIFRRKVSGATTAEELESIQF